ncbi:MAG: type IV pilus twitching motility protein PilT [Proteobacteria bacterium]|nr:type IV pilus twitching motility protein PilT [Pseudomonadota bacterium]
MDLVDILKIAVKNGASDIHIKVGMPPLFRINSVLHPLKTAPKFTPETLNKMVMGTMTETQQETFKLKHEIDFAYGVSGLGRFRVNAFQQRGTIGAVLRVIPHEIKSFDELHLPKVIKKLASEHRGLILVTGTTGSGKSTTLASMIDYINSHRTAHIMTIEDPVECLHRDKKSIINQREVGFDTESFSVALRSALRQDPDVILVGEMRDLETIEIALTAAETGHLVLSTLHTIDAQETINRIVSVFPPSYQQQTRSALAGVLKGIISQRLVVKSGGKARVPAIEVMVASARVRECIIDATKTKEINEAIAEGNVAYGMQTFDQSLMQLMGEKLITYDEAMKNASNPADFALKLKGVSSTSDLQWEGFNKGENGEEVGSPAGPEEGLDIERF